MLVLKTYHADVVVSGVSPTSGTAFGGTTVTVGGRGFTGRTITATLGGTDVGVVTIVNDTTLTFTSPAGTTGAAALVVTIDGVAYTLNAFSYTFAITDIPNLWGSWEGGDGSTTYVTLDTTPDPDVVSVWKAQNGTTPTLIAAGDGVTPPTAARPPLVNGPSGTYKALDFSSGTYALANHADRAGLNSITALTIAAVFKRTAATIGADGYTVDIGDSVTLASTIGWLFEESDDKEHGVYRSGTVLTALPAVAADTSWHTFVYVWKSTATDRADVYIDGTKYAAVAPAVDAFNNGNMLSVGAFWLQTVDGGPLLSNPSLSYIQELVIAKTAVSDGAAANIDTFLASKYGI